MKSLSAVVTTHAQQLLDEKPFVWLFAAPVPTTPVTMYRLTNYTEIISWGTDSVGDPILWYPYPIAHHGIPQTAEGDLPSIRIDVGNATRELMADIESYDGLVGQDLDIYLVSIDDLGNRTPAIHEQAQITGCVAKNEVLSFTVAAYNLYRARFPSERYVGKHCRFQFGGNLCGYNVALGNFTTCPKTFEACEERGDDEVANGFDRQHPERFGGFLGIPRFLRAS